MDVNNHLIVTSKGKFKWVGEFVELQEFLNELLQQQTSWTTPSGGSKLFVNDDLTIRYYSTSSSLTIKGKEQESLKAKLYLISSKEEAKDEDECEEERAEDNNHNGGEEDKTA